MKEIHNNLVLSKEEQYRLLSLARAGDHIAKEKMILLNQGLVKSIVAKFASGFQEWDDLMQIGYIGLIKAIERFDTSYDVMFSTYAVPLIVGEIKRHLRDDGRIKFSRDMKTKILLIKKIREQFAKEEGRQPKLSELAKLSELSMEELIEVLEGETALNSMESLDDPDHFETDKETSDSAKEEEHQIDTILLHSIIESLPMRERQIVILRYFKDMTQTEIAQVLEISQVHVSRLEKKILKKIGASFEPDTQLACQEAT